MKTNSAHLNALRSALDTLSLDGLFVPLTDEHMSEYVGGYAERLKWLTGFEGSAGNAVVLKDKAAIFIDGRYTIQVKMEVDETLFEHHHFEKYPLLKWLTDHMPEGGRIGYDNELATRGWTQEAEKALRVKKGELVALEDNPIDAVWQKRPLEPLAPAKPHTLAHAGEDSSDKRARIADHLARVGAQTAVITALDSIAWAFNIRGEDVPNTPVVHSFALLHKDGSGTLFIQDQKVTSELRAHLGNGIEIAPRHAFYDRLTALGQEGKSVLADPATNNARVFERLMKSGATVIEGADPCILMKAVKNPTEIAGSKSAHMRDGAAVTDFLAWFDRTSPNGGEDEISAAEALWTARARHPELMGRSFDTISGAGPNGAIVHYRVSPETNRAINPGDIYLVDSGAQYLDGTTDITRTLAAGIPAAAAADEVKDRFTRVLKGHIALATARFPRGTSGMALDSLARRALWDAGLDYDHGTGHGVGSYLAVHEGPQRIAKFGSTVPLEPGMILSNEPGYYKTGGYGIRIENLILVVEDKRKSERDMLRFETLTLAPIDQRLIHLALLTCDEKEWLDQYHARVRGTLMPLVLPETQDFLERMTQPVSGR